MRSHLAKMKVQGANIAVTVRIYLVILSLLCPSVFNAQSEFQSSLRTDFVLSDTFVWNLRGEQIIWGTKFHSFNVEKSIKSIPGSRVGGSWCGWEAWNSSEVWWGHEKLIGVVEENIVIYAWLNLGAQLETLPELHKRSWRMISRSGVTTSFPSGSCSLMISPDVMGVEWPWSVSGLITPPNMHGFQVGLGLHSSLYGRDWHLLLGGRLDKLNAHLIVEGPDLRISCSLVLHGAVTKSLSHRHGSFGGNSQWKVSW